MPNQIVNPRWSYVGLQHMALTEESDGRVFGRVYKDWGTWHGTTDMRPVGEFLTKEQAQAAVERALFLPRPSSPEGV